MSRLTYVIHVLANNFPMDGIECVLHYCMWWTIRITLLALSGLAVMFEFFPSNFIPALFVASFPIFFLFLFVVLTVRYYHYSALEQYLTMYSYAMTRRKTRGLSGERLEDNSEVISPQEIQERDCSLVGA